MPTDNLQNFNGGLATEKMMTAGSTGNYSQTMHRTASWCPNCGRRRGPDGRCPDCDPWWTSPIVQIGGPLCLFITLALLGGIAISQSGNSSRVARPLPSVATNPGVAPTFANPSPASPYGTYSGGYNSGYVAPYNSYMPPRSAPAFTPPPVNITASMAPSAEELQWRAIEQLRRMTAYTDAVVEQQRQYQWEQQRAVSQQGNYDSYPVFRQYGGRMADAY